MTNYVLETMVDPNPFCTKEYAISSLLVCKTIFGSNPALLHKSNITV